MILATGQHLPAKAEAGKLDWTPDCLCLQPQSWTRGVAEASQAGGVTLAPGGGQLLSSECPQGMGNTGGRCHEAVTFPIHVFHSQTDQNDIPFLS